MPEQPTPMTTEVAINIFDQLIEQTRLLPSDYRNCQEAVRVLKAATGNLPVPPAGLPVPDNKRETVPGKPPATPPQE